MKFKKLGNKEWRKVNKNRSNYKIKKKKRIKSSIELDAD